MTSGKGHTSSRRSWITDMWRWERSEWSLCARDNCHDREHRYTTHRGATPVAGRANVAPQLGAAKRCLAEEPQDLRLFGCGIAGDCSGAFQLVWKEDVGTTRRRERATTATRFAGQHRQQRAGVEEP